MELKRQLKKTWSPFFGHFGRLYSVQERTIPRVLSGENAIVVSPAASGKTEAVTAPLIERLLAEDIETLGLLYISPTRALVNDLEARLRDPVEMVGLTLSVRTGDRPRFSGKSRDNVLITTPESLDSMLCRFPAQFGTLRAIVLDELHLLDNTPRGDQMICLLNRIRKTHARHPVQHVALSATLSDPRETAGRYFKPFTIIDTRETRPLTCRIVESLDSAVVTLRKEKLHKALLFCNSRKDVEQLSLDLAGIWPKDKIVVHHGSLSRAEREATESTFRFWKWGICISTMTLEIGIDIGDVDVSILYKPPPSPSSFLQRIGRSRRRRKDMFGICVCSEESERITFERFIEMASEGRIETTEYRPDLSVAVQQIFSILYANPGGVRVGDLHHVLSPLLEEKGVGSIIEHLIGTGHIEPGIRDKLRATTRLMDMGERGTIHSNIPDSREYRVVDVGSGRAIGKLVLQATPGTTFLLSGKVWEIVEKGKDRVGVRAVNSLSRRTHFTRRFQIGSLSHLLPPTLRRDLYEGGRRDQSIRT